MKLLVAIQSSENPKTLAKTTLRWAGRTGFNTRVFIPDENQRADYEAAIKEANHNFYLALPKTIIVTKTKPKDFAKSEGFDLIAYIPDDLHKWDAKANHDINHLKFAESLGMARFMMNRDPEQSLIEFPNGTTIERVS